MSLRERQLGSYFTVCATDATSSRVSWRITFPSVVGETELMYVKQHTWYYGCSREELTGDRLEERCERDGGYTFRLRCWEREGSWQDCRAVDKHWEAGAGCWDGRQVLSLVLAVGV